MQITTCFTFASTALALVLLSGKACAQATASDAGSAPAVHHAVKAKPRAGAPLPENTTMHVDDWFSYGAPKEADIEREAPGVKIKVQDPALEDENIVVYGARLKRDFQDIAPGSDLTSPQALDAAQPMVPGIGNSCSYKTGCFDSSQESLRDSIPALMGGN